jgi:hypothetical protein
VRSNFGYLVKRQYRYGNTVFFNTNTCRTNIDDVKQLVEIAHDNGISCIGQRLAECSSFGNCRKLAQHVE